MLWMEKEKSSIQQQQCLALSHAPHPLTSKCFTQNKLKFDYNWHLQLIENISFHIAIARKAKTLLTIFFILVHFSMSHFTYNGGLGKIMKNSILMFWVCPIRSKHDFEQGEKYASKSIRTRHSKMCLCTFWILCLPRNINLVRKLATLFAHTICWMEAMKLYTHNKNIIASA